jgi:glutathione S-transferase
MKLYGFPISPNTWKVRAVAVHLGIVLDDQVVDLSRGEQRTPDYLALNPTGRTPTLVDGEFVLWESNAIMQYLASGKPNALWTDDARTRADIARWQSWQLEHWGKEACQPLLFERFVKAFFNLGPCDAAVVAKGTDAFHREARVLEARLAKHPYLAGTGVTLAHFSVVAPLFYAEKAELPLTPYPRIRDWFARVSSLPAWRDTAPAAAAA